VGTGAFARPAERSEASALGVSMAIKSKHTGLGIALGAALGAVAGVLAGHVAIWLGIGFAIGMAIGSTSRQKTCPNCEAAKRNQELGARS